MGLSDITNDVPIELSYYGNKNKCHELAVFKQQIMEIVKHRPNVVFACDRLYSSYELI